MDQIAAGLKSDGLLRSISSYPKLFAPFLIDTGEVIVDDVLQAIYIDDKAEMQPPENIEIGFLQHFVAESNTTHSHH